MNKKVLFFIGCIGSRLLLSYISKVYQNSFEITVIPHTLKLTNLKNFKVNSLANVELDIFSKYIYKYSN